MMIYGTAAAVAATLMLASGGTSLKQVVGTAEIDQAVTSKLSTLYGINSKIIAHVDLTKPFGTTSRWTLVIGKQPDEESTTEDGAGSPRGTISACFVKNAEPDCSEAMFLEEYQEQRTTLSPGRRPFYELIANDVVYSGPGKTMPLLMMKACTTPGGANGNCGVATFLFDYDRKADRFQSVFFNVTGRNNNEETRFVEARPLLGAVIIAEPFSGTPRPRANPYAYSVEVYKRNVAGIYARVLSYRGGTSYGDGNPLAVIDSEMPETLRRLGLWKVGDPLPIPKLMPATCKRLVMRKGVEWCE
jgi:hypothetical protein